MQRSGKDGGKSWRGGDWRDWCERYEKLRRKWSDRFIDVMIHPKRRREQVKCFQVDEDIQRAVMDQHIDRLDIMPLNQCDNTRDYQESLRNLLNVEEVYQAIGLRRYDQFNMRLDYEWVDEEKTLARYMAHLAGLMNKEPSLVACDYVILNNVLEHWNFGMQICEIRGNNVILPKIELSHYHELMDRVNVSFVSSGIPTRACEEAIDLCDRLRLQTLILDKNQASGAESDLFRCSHEYIQVSEFDREKLDARLDELNPRQRQAVERIMAPRCGLRPYILFGPPGTGKSHTLTEAVYQIYMRTRADILVCVNSNICADDLHKKLQKLIPEKDLVRLCAGEVFHQHACRVVVTTNIKSSRVDKQFDYVFIDEAGHANEAETLVPICRLKRSGCLVLAGDPKQLGPVVLCREAGQLGLQHSLLERQFGFETYKRTGEDNQYNPDYITKLLISYRCDPRVLSTSNKLFYKNELECVNETPKSILKMLHLTSPLQLLVATGQEWRPQGSTSWGNCGEAQSCVDVIIGLYKMGFEPAQIGVITPYRNQVGELKRALKKSLSMERAALRERFRETQLVEKKPDKKQEDFPIGCIKFNNCIDSDLEPIKSTLHVIDGKVYERKEVIHDWRCKIDTVDGFQGNEREVIIISTVRTSSDQRKLDFLNDARRFNVAISRAKWLLIIVGSPSALEIGKHWPHLISATSRELSHWLHGNSSQWPLITTNNNNNNEPNKR